MSPTALLLLAAASATAQELMPIRPVRAVLRVEPGRMVVDLRGDSIYWLDQVVRAERVAEGWSESARLSVENYANAHLRLALDGRRARGTLAHVEHRQRPWETHERGELRLRLTYPEPAPGAKLSGEADFFTELRAAEEEGHSHGTHDAQGHGGEGAPEQVYLTRLSVPGARPARFELTPEKPGFELPADDARRGAFAMAGEALVTGLGSALRAASGWPAVLALALALGPEWPRRRRAAPAALALGAAVALLEPVPPAAAWAAGVATALAAGGWLDRRGGLSAAAAGAAALGAVWSTQAAPGLPGAPTPALSRAAAWLGVCAGGAALLAAAMLAASVERRRAAEDSQAHAAELFGRRRRLAATAVLLASGYGLALSLS